MEIVPIVNESSHQAVTMKHEWVSSKNCSNKLKMDHPCELYLHVLNESDRLKLVFIKIKWTRAKIYPYDRLMNHSSWFVLTNLKWATARMGLSEQKTNFHIWELSILWQWVIQQICTHNKKTNHGELNVFMRVEWIRILQKYQYEMNEPCQIISILNKWLNQADELNECSHGRSVNHYNTASPRLTIMSHSSEKISIYPIES